MKPSIKYGVIHLNRGRYTISAMCRFFGVSRSGYYDFARRQAMPTKDAVLVDLIRTQQEKCRQTY